MSEYIQLGVLDNVLSDVGNRIVTSQQILKCLKYDTPDALSQPDLTMPEILEIVGKGSDPKKQQRLYQTPFNDLIVEDVRSELRVFSDIIDPNNLYLAEINIAFQIIIHNSIWALDSNQYRFLVFIKEILRLINGYNARSIGEFKLSGPIKVFVWNKNFSGYQLHFSTRLC